MLKLERSACPVSFPFYTLSPPLFSANAFSLILLTYPSRPLSRCSHCAEKQGVQLVALTPFTSNLRPHRAHLPASSLYH